MKFTLYSRKNKLDEMQEQTLRCIEANGYWLLWSGLLIAILVQIVLRAPARQWCGEFVVFMLSCVYMVAECLHNGIWDRHLSANTGTNLLLSLTASVVVMLVTGIANGYWLLALIPGVITGVLCFVILQLCMHATEKRRETLDDTDEDEK